VPDHTWLGLSDEDWAVNLRMYATQPERFLQLHCEERSLVQSPDAGSQLGRSWPRADGLRVRGSTI